MIAQLEKFSGYVSKFTIEYNSIEHHLMLISLNRGCSIMSELRQRMTKRLTVKGDVRTDTGAVRSGSASACRALSQVAR